MKSVLLILLIFVFMSFFIGRELYINDINHNMTRDIYNYTNNIFSNMSFNQTYISSNLRIQKVANSFVTFIHDSVTEFLKYGIEFGYNNPQYDYPVFYEWVKLLVGLYILSLIMPMIIPILAAGYLLCYYLVKGIKFIIQKVRRGQELK